MLFGFLTTLNHHHRSFRLMLFFVSGIPAADLYFRYQCQNLGINPFQIMIENTGFTSLSFLLFSLLITPLRRWLTWFCTWRTFAIGKRLSDWNFLIRSRRMLGLYAFAYACLHFWIYAYFDLGLDWYFFIEDALDRNFIFVGVLSLIMLTPLAITSISIVQKRMGRHWRRLHRSSYLIAILVLTHWWMLEKYGEWESLIYCLMLFVLLSHRVVVASGKYFRRTEDDGMVSFRNKGAK